MMGGRSWPRSERARRIRAARALLDWRQLELAEQAGVSLATVKDIERDAAITHDVSLDKIRRAFRDAGIEFIRAGRTSLKGGMGVRLKG